MKSWWYVLGVPRGSDRAAIRRAYAKQLKATHPEDDPQGFMALREAYEAALSWIDYDSDDFDDVEHVDAEAGFDDPAAFASPQANVERVDAVIADPVEPDPFAEARAAEQTELRRRTAALEAGLRGPWHGDAAALTAQLDAILAAPALIEIDTRERIEIWLSGLLADTVPRSDAILSQAIQAFGWDAEGNHPPAVWRILARIDEWRMIGSMRDIDHPLSAGWRALTLHKRSGWHHRIGALRPGVAGQVQQLFDLADYQTPGIAHSFSPHAAAWWREFLSGPRLGFVDLCAILLGGLAAVIFVATAAAPIWQVGGAAVVLAAGGGFAWLRLTVIAPWRLRREAMGTGFGWPDWGWLIPWGMAAAMLMLLPVGRVAAGAIAALALVATFWMAAVAGSAPQRSVALSGFLAFGGLALVGGAGFIALPGAHQLALGIFGVASVLIGRAGAGALADILWRVNRFPVVTASGVAILLLGVAAMRGGLPDVPQPGVHWGAAAITGMVLLTAVRDVADGSPAVPLVPWLRWGLWMVLIVAAIFSAPPVERGGTQPQRPPVQVKP